MAYSEYLADRVCGSLKNLNSSFEEKKMFGGVCYLVDDKMCVGIVKNELMARIDPEIYEEALTKNGQDAKNFDINCDSWR